MPGSRLLIVRSKVMRILFGCTAPSVPATKFVAVMSMTSAPRSDSFGLPTSPGVLLKLRRLLEGPAMPVAGPVILTDLLRVLTSMMNAAPRYCGGMGGVPGSCGCVPTPLSCEHAAAASITAVVASVAVRRPRRVKSIPYLQRDVDESLSRSAGRVAATDHGSRVRRVSVLRSQRHIAWCARDHRRVLPNEAETVAM